ncbi:chaperonin 10-like protein [Mrakia frigida]|uniref:NAD(P)-dependent alcohol dehydrogenase n=1 Tax=Mrakia frigida TaxID=29902 RepID=UPI003FCC0BF7
MSAIVDAIHNLGGGSKQEVGVEQPLRDNPSFVLRGIHDTYYEDRAIPAVGPHDVLIEISKTGICGSDVHYHEHACIGDFVLGEPMVLGHESSGIIVRVGASVKTHKLGDRVSLEPGVSCRTCPACKSGHYELCPDMQFAATPPFTGGTLGRYYSLPSDIAHLIPDSMTMEDGAMIEPLAVGVHSVSNLAGVKAGQIVAVFGAGPVGLLCMAVAKALGASQVIAIDINAGRLEFAGNYAASSTFLPPPLEPNEKRMDYSRRATGLLRAKLGLPERGTGAVDVVIEASGAEVCVQMGCFLVKEQGKYVQVGMGSPDVQIPLTSLATKQATFVGSFRYGSGDYPLAISLVASGKIDLKPLVTHRYEFTEAVEAFAATKDGKGRDGKGIIKAIINCPK